MKLFNVEITEVLKRTLTAPADSKEEAEQIIQEMYDKERVVLTADDFIESDITVLD